MTKMEERKKAIVCMEYLARQINNEDILMGWLMCGVPDGDIKYGNLDITEISDDDYMVNEGFKDIMTCFLRKMSSAYQSGGLWCGNVVSGTKGDN